MDYEDSIEVGRRDLDGLPESYIERLRTVEVDGATRYRVGLDYPELHPFLDSAHDSELRRELFLEEPQQGGGHECGDSGGGVGGSGGDGSAAWL